MSCTKSSWNRENRALFDCLSRLGPVSRARSSGCASPSDRPGDLPFRAAQVFFSANLHSSPLFYLDTTNMSAFLAATSAASLGAQRLTHALKKLTTRRAYGCPVCSIRIHARLEISSRGFPRRSSWSVIGQGLRRYLGRTKTLEKLQRFGRMQSVAANR